MANVQHMKTTSVSPDPVLAHDDILTLNQRHLQLVLDEYRGYFNTSRPHQGIDQRRPSTFGKPALGRKPPAGARVVARPVLGGLHHVYQIAA